MAGPAVVIVTYNSEDVIESCLAPLAGLEVVVVDNASTDRTVQRAANVRVIANQENRGFAAAVNQGVGAVAADLILILNPDVRVRSSLDPLAAACLEHGLAGGRLTDDQGRTQQGFTVRRFPTPLVLALELLGLNRLWRRNPWNVEYRYLDRDLTIAGQADQPAGAFLMVRRDLWKILGGFDESFWPIWFEDVDFCRRAASAGFPAWYEPATWAAHSGGHSIQKIDGASRQLYWYDSLLRYVKKHFPASAYLWVCWAGVLGTLPRAIVGTIQERSIDPVVNCFKVLKLLGRRLVSRPPSGAQRPGSEY